MTKTQLAAALAGVPAGMQGLGSWLGRRQVFVRFANEAETATLYTVEGLSSELKRIVQRSRFHSVCLCGRDVLGNVEYVSAVFRDWEGRLPVLLDTDGQRPEALDRLGRNISLVQVSLDFVGPDVLIERALQTVSGAARMGYDHSLVLSAREETSDGQLLRVVESAHAASTGVAIVVHPHATGNSGVALERRWASLLEKMQLLHDDVRIMLRLAPPAGMR